MVVERSPSNYSTMADMLGADGSSVVESCREKLPAKAACCMRPDISQISISPSRLEEIVCRPSRDIQNAWDANLCCCHIRAGEIPPNTDDSPGVSSWVRCSCCSHLLHPLVGQQLPRADPIIGDV